MMTEHLIKKIRFFHLIQWINHIWKQLLKGFLLLCIYFLIRALFQWKTSIMVFYKYKGGILSCIFFYVFLKIIKNPPGMKISLRMMDEILQHGRASAFWQFRKRDDEIAKLLIEDSYNSLNENFMAARKYVKVCPPLILLSAIFLSAGILINTIPSQHRIYAEEKISFNNELREKIEAIEEAEYSENDDYKDEEDKCKDDLKFKELLDNLKNSYTKEEALNYINNSSTSSGKVDSLLDAVTDAEENYGRSKNAGDDEDSKSLAEGFSELLSNESDSENENVKESDENLYSNARGKADGNSKDGQGGSGSSYSEGADEFEEVIQNRDASEDEIYDSGSEMFQISSGKADDTHFVIASEIEAVNSNINIYESENGNIFKSDGEIIINFKGIPKDRMEFVKAYYKGE